MPCGTLQKSEEGIGEIREICEFALIDHNWREKVHPENCVDENHEVNENSDVDERGDYEEIGVNEDLENSQLLQLKID